MLSSLVLAFLILSNYSYDNFVYHQTLSGISVVDFAADKAGQSAFELTVAELVKGNASWVNITAIEDRIQYLVHTMEKLVFS